MNHYGKKRRPPEFSKPHLDPWDASEDEEAAAHREWLKRKEAAGVPAIPTNSIERRQR